MAIAITSPVTGQAQTGFTAPTYTLLADRAPDNNSSQWVVSALGGTQVGVTTHSVNSPFTVTVKWPSRLRRLAESVLNAFTGKRTRVPFNNYTFLVRKGAPVDSQGNVFINEARVTMKVAAGAESQSPAEIRAMASLLFGVCVQQSAGIGDTTVTGI